MEKTADNWPDWGKRDAASPSHASYALSVHWCGVALLLASRVLGCSMCLRGAPSDIHSEESLGQEASSSDIGENDAKS